MNLGTILDQISTMDDDVCIFAMKPWTPTSFVVTERLETDFHVPKGVSEQGLDYFLEVHVAKEALQVFGEHPPTKEEQRRLLIFYAENDAYPDWVYHR